MVGAQPSSGQTSPAAVVSVSAAEHDPEAPAPMIDPNLCERTRILMFWARRCGSSPTSPDQDQPSMRTCGRGGLSLIASYLSTAPTQYLASTSSLPLHALYQNTCSWCLAIA